MKTQIFSKTLFFFLFTFATTFAQVTVEFNNFNVNGSPLNLNTVNFNNNSSVNLSLNVKLTTLDGSFNNTLGNLFLYYKSTSSGNAVQVGFNAVTFTQNNPPFVPQTNYTSTISFNSTTLLASNFYATGGVFYAVYVNNNNISFQSQNISVVGGTLTNGSTLSITSLSYSDGFSLANNQIVVPTNQSRNINLSVYYNLPQVPNPNNTPTYIKVFVVSGDYYYQIGEQSINDMIPTQITFYDLSINPSQVQAGSYLLIRAYSLNRHWINKNSAAIVKSNPIGFNDTVYNNQVKNYGEIADTLFAPQAIVWNDSGTRVGYYITNYQWQSSTDNLNWFNIPNATSQNFINTLPLLESKLYRRIAIGNNGYYNISNFISIYLRGATKDFINNICCDQNVFGTNQAQPFSGNVVSTNYTYQWQILPINPGGTPQWRNIIGATNPTYQYISSYTGPGTSTISFRRLIILGNFAVGISNVATIYRNPQLRIKNDEDKTLEKLESFSSRLKTYPNPTNDFYYLELNEESFEGKKIKLNELISGNEIIFSSNKINDKLLQIDCSSLKIGNYILTIENENGEIATKKIIKI